MSIQYGCGPGSINKVLVTQARGAVSRSPASIQKAWAQCHKARVEAETGRSPGLADSPAATNC